MLTSDRLVDFGTRAFTRDHWHLGIPFQPVLYLGIWAAVIHMVFFSDLPEIPFESVGPWVRVTWMVLALVCPPLSLLAWWLISQSTWHKSSMAGLSLRLGSDIGMFASVLAFHLAVVVTHPMQTKSDILSRYIMAAVMVSVFTLVIRDVWSVLAMERAALIIRHYERATGGRLHD